MLRITSVQVHINGAVPHKTGLGHPHAGSGLDPMARKKKDRNFNNNDRIYEEILRTMVHNMLFLCVGSEGGTSEKFLKEFSERPNISSLYSLVPSASSLFLSCWLALVPRAFYLSIDVFMFLMDQ